MARYESPDDQNNPSGDEPTRRISHDGYQEPPPAPDNMPWHRKPVALVASGAVGAVLVALIVYGLAKAITGGSTSDTTPTSLTPVTTAATSMAPRTVTETVTATPTTTTTEPTTTTETTETTTTTTTTEPTTTTPSPPVSTVTETQTETVTEPPPTLPEP